MRCAHIVRNLDPALALSMGLNKKIFFIGRVRKQDFLPVLPAPSSGYLENFPTINTMEKSSDALFSDSGHLIEQDARYVLPRSSYRSRLLSWQNCLIVFLILTNLTIILYASRMNKSPKLHVEKPEDLGKVGTIILVYYD